MNKKKTCRKNKKQHACIKLKLREKGQISINAAYITLKKPQHILDNIFTDSDISVIG